MQRRTARNFAVLLISGALALNGCQRPTTNDGSAEINRLTAELETAQAKIASLEKELKSANDSTAVANSEGDALKQQLADSKKLVADRDARIATLDADLTKLRRSDAVVFSEIAAVQQKGLNGTAMERYQKFVLDFPESALVPHANRAMTALAPTAQREAQIRTAMIDPKKEEREVLKRFADGLVTVEEIAPIVRNKTSAEVVRLLGPPSTSFRNGTELGYANRVIDTATGAKETLVINFDAKGVTSLRVGYRGREIRP